MCAIAGYRGSGNREKLKKMLLALDHRGPDDSGLFVHDDVGVGNNRLSIIDLSEKGHQPIFNEDNTVCVVYNGEIYNFESIRKDLVGKYKFKSNTDTEVILHAYEEWGVDCLKRFNGMFAFVIYDKKKDILFGARDRIGEKPLKYYWDGKLFAFASEIKGLLPILDKKPELDEDFLNQFLVLQYVPVPRTGFKNIFKLPAGSYFVFQKGKLEIKRYWELDFSKKLHLDEEEWCRLVFSKVKLAVKSCMLADVPVGAFLSGGLDSSSIVALMAENSKKKLQTFSIGFEQAEFDETKYARLVSGIYKTDHEELIVDDKLMQKTLVKMYDYYDEPLADNSLIPTILLAQMVGKKVKVALSGDGGDENFGGYERYALLRFGERYQKTPGLLREFIKFPASLFQKTRLFAGTLDLPFEQKYLHYNPFYEKRKTDLKVWTYDSNLSDVDNALKFDINSYLPEDLLYKIDTAAMSASLEVRAPFLNYELLELTAQMPVEMKIKGFQTKYLLKKIIEKEKLLPSEIIFRKKKGFVVPMEKWFKGGMKDFVNDTLASKRFQNLGIFANLKSVHELNSNELFSLVSISMWLNKYL